MSDTAHLVEIRGVYDGWSVEVRADGTMRNRWANPDGTPIEGYETRWRATQDWIEDRVKENGEHE